MTKRVLLVAPDATGGEGVYTNLIREAAPPGVSYSVATGFKQGAPGARRALGTEIALNRLLRPRTIPDIGFRALRLRARFDLIHVHAHPVRLTGVGDTPVVMSENASSVVYLRDYLGWDHERLECALRRSRRMYRALGIRDRLLAMGRVTRAYVFSEWARQLNIRWGADPEKLEVLRPGFRVPAPTDRGDRETFSFLFVGSDFERKGGFDLIEAFARISSDLPHARLVIEGRDPRLRNPDRLIHEWVNAERRERVLALLDALMRGGVAQRLTGVTRHALTEAVYPGADAFVMPTLAEGFGFTNVEAMSHGLPVISTRLGPIAEVVEHDESGLLVAPGDVAGLAEAMARLASDPGRAQAMGHAARDSFMRNYTLDRFRARLGEFYARALDG